MTANQGKDTGPEMAVRKALHRMGYRYRLHGKNLPGRPDLVFASRMAVLEVRSCFWHGHGCGRSRTPKTRQSCWIEKVAANKARDARNRELTSQAGWPTHDVWECELRRDPEAALAAAQAFLDARAPSRSRRRTDDIQGAVATTREEVRPQATESTGIPNRIGRAERPQS